MIPNNHNGIHRGRDSPEEIKGGLPQLAKAQSEWSKPIQYDQAESNKRASSPSFMEKLSMWKYNLSYSLKNNSLWSSKPTLSKPNSETDVKRATKEIPKSEIIVFAGGQAFPPDASHEFLEEAHKMQWFTYRSKILHFDKSSISTDAGWGCLVRVAQMLLAYTLRRAFPIHFIDDRLLLKLFFDNATNFHESPFSIRNIVQTAHNYYDLTPGQWFKGSTVSLALQKIVENNGSSPFLKKFRILPCIQGTIFLDEVDHLVYNTPPKAPESPESPEKGAGYAATHPQEWDHSVLILISSVLGLEGVSPEYHEVVKALLELPTSTGIIGGENNKALYFFGYQGNKLLYLDPHYVQPALESIKDLDKPEFCKTYYCKDSLCLDMKEMQTSVTFGFYVQNKQEFDTFLKQLNDLHRRHGDFWFISVMNSQSRYVDDEVDESGDVKRPKVIDDFIVMD